MWEAVFLVTTTLLSLAYAHRAHRQSVQAPILKLSLCDPTTGRPLEFPNTDTQSATIELSLADYESREKSKSGDNVVGVRLPLIIRNGGTKTAHGIKLHARYSVLFKVATNGTLVEDADKVHWTVIEHSVPDLHPKQAHKLQGDLLIPTDEFLQGLRFRSSAVTADKKEVDYEVWLGLAANVEIIAFSQDTQPLFRQCIIKLVEKNVDA